MIKPRHNKIVSGTTKSLYQGTEEGKSILSFTDGIREWKGTTQRTISGKAVLANRMSAHLMTCLETIGLPTHFLKSLNMHDQEVKRLDPMQVVFRVRNIASGSLVERFDLDEGTVLPRPIIEFYYKNEAGRYTLVTEDHMLAFQWIDPYEMEEIMTIAYRSNDYLNGMFSGIGIRLVDFQMELGRLWGEYGELYLMIMDELSLASMRLWDIKTNQPFSEDIKSYQEVAVRLGIIPREGLVQGDGVNKELVSSLGDIENILANDTSRKIRPITPRPTKSNLPRG